MDRCCGSNWFDAEDAYVSRLGSGLEHAFERAWRWEQTCVLVDASQGESTRQTMADCWSGLGLVAAAKRAMAGRTALSVDVFHLEQMEAWGLAWGKAGW